MAENFVNAGVVLSNTQDTTIYTCPAGTKAVVIGCQVANTSTTSTNEISMFWTDSSQSNDVTWLAYEIAVPVQSAFEPISGKLVLEAGDSIKGQESVGTAAHVSLSVLELS